MYVQFLSAACIAVCAIGSPTKKASEITQHDVDHAIERISEELLNRFELDRGWEPMGKDTGWLSKGIGGTTAVATLSLLSANQSQHSTEMKIALQHLETIRQPSTYVCALRTMIWCQLSGTHDKQLKRDVNHLIRSMGRTAGGWGYDARMPVALDKASPIIRQFGTIALLEATRTGIHVPPACFGAIAEAVLQTQQENGGWSHAQEKVAPNTTVAGFNCLLSVQEAIGNQLSQNQKQLLSVGLTQALDWLHKHYSPKQNTGGTAMMTYLCNLERAAISCGLDQLRNKDWYRQGVAAVLKAHCSTKKRIKGSTVNLSFALLFLTRGRVPLALVELRENKTTFDHYRLAQKMSTAISNQIEMTLGWRVVTNNDSVERWLQAPLLLVQDPSVFPDDLKLLAQYLDRGGLLVLFGDKKNAQNFTAIANRLCPEATFQSTRKNHWTHTLIQNAVGVHIEAWHDGIRDRIILVRNTAKNVQELKQTKLTKAIINLCCGAAEMSQWKSRLWRNQIDINPKAFILASHEGNWDKEQYGLQSLGIKTQQISAITKQKVVLVGGTDGTQATKKLTREVVELAKQGGVVLIEPIGGNNQFATKMREKIGKMLSIIIEPDRELQTAMRPIEVRGTTKILGTELTPPLVMRVGLGQIIFLDGDFRSALLHQPSWGIHGYDTKTAVDLLHELSNRIK